MRWMVEINTVRETRMRIVRRTRFLAIIYGSGETVSTRSVRDTPASYKKPVGFATAPRALPGQRGGR